MSDLSLIYFPSAIAIGAMHALEPGHAKTLTAAYLIGIKGTKQDATLLGISVALSHSLVVIGLSLLAVFLGREAFTGEAEYLLRVGSGIAVIILGIYLLLRRLKSRRLLSTSHTHRNHMVEHHTHHDEHDHDFWGDEEHARSHLADLPDYVQRGERPSIWQIILFGTVGGLVPCPAAVSVMLLALSLNQTAKGLLLVLGFSLGLALTLVGVGLVVVLGVSKLSHHSTLAQLSRHAPIVGACLVILSGIIALVLA